MRVTPGDFFRQNEWANLKLLEACGQLTDDQLDTSATGTFGSIRDTIGHIVGAEGGYATRLGYEPTPRLQRGDQWPDFEMLAAMASAASEALIQAAADADEGWITVGDENEQVLPSVLLVQAVHHSTEHRTQINTVLTVLGIEALELSSWDWAEATDRMRIP